MKLHLPVALLSALMAFSAVSQASHDTYLPSEVSSANGVYSVDASRFVDMGKGSYSWGSSQIGYENGKNLFSPPYEDGSRDSANGEWNAETGTYEWYGGKGSFEYLGELQSRIYVQSGQEPFYGTVAFQNMKDDTALCWGYAAANQIQYWQSYYGVFYKGKKSLKHGYTYEQQYHETLGGAQSLEVGMLFYDSWNNKGNGGVLEAGLAWYMDGKAVNPSAGSQLNGKDSGGYFSNYFTGSSYTTYSVSGSTSTATLTTYLAELLGYKKNGSTYTKLADGHLASMAVQNGSNMGHALTICGFDINANGELVLKIADSDDQAYGIYNLIVRSNGSQLKLYYDDGSSYSDFYMQQLGGIKVNSELVAMRAAYDAANEGKAELVWEGGKGWDKAGYDEADVLPDSVSPWAVYVDGDGISTANAGYYTTYFTENRDVVFNDTASDTAVTLEESVAVGGMTIVNSEKDYSFSGNHSITATSFSKSGTGSVSVADSDFSISGDAQLSGGSMSFSGSGSLSVSGATALESTALSFAGNASGKFASLEMKSGSVSMQDHSTLTVDGEFAVSGGSVTMNGYALSLSAGSLSMSGDAAMNLEQNAGLKAGTTTISGGTLALSMSAKAELGATGLSGGAISLQKGNTPLDTCPTLSASSLTVSASGSLSMADASSATLGSLTVQDSAAADTVAVSLSGTAALSVSGNTTLSSGVVNLAGSSTFSATAGTTTLGGGTLRLTESSSATLKSLQVDSGRIEMTNSALGSAGYSLKVTDTVTVAAAGSLDMSGSSALHAGTLDVNGGSVRMTHTAFGSNNLDVDTLKLRSGGSLDANGKIKLVASQVQVSDASLALVTNSRMTADTVELNKGSSMQTHGNSSVSVNTSLSMQKDGQVLATMTSQSSSGAAMFATTSMGVSSEGAYLRGESSSVKAQLLNAHIAVSQGVSFSLQDATLGLDAAYGYYTTTVSGNGADSLLDVSNVDVRFTTESATVLAASDMTAGAYVMSDDNKRYALTETASTYVISSSVLSNLTLTGSSLTLDFTALGTDWQNSDFLSISLSGVSYDFASGLTLTALMGGSEIALNEVFYATGSGTDEVLLGSSTPQTTLYIATSEEVVTQFLAEAPLAVVPEPATATLSLLGLAALAARRRRRG